MLNCPLCKKTVPGLSKQCPTCRTDLSLLVDYVSHLQDGLNQADALTRSGQLGEAVWAYLEVLEVDPENVTARQQVGQVAAAVRQFDRIHAGRRWLGKLHREARWRHGVFGASAEGGSGAWRSTVLLVLLVLAGLVLGCAVGYHSGQQAVSRVVVPED